VDRIERPWTYALAGTLLLGALWWAFVQGTRVPLLGMVDLAVHEAGHVLFVWAPRDVMLGMGNGFQVLVPLVFAGAFTIQHRDLAGGAAALGWAATSLQDASVYIADAPHRRLPLLGPEDSHDWWQLLGGHGWLSAADDLARVVWVLAVLVWLAGVALLVIGLRHDRAWRAGAAGTVYLPWRRGGVTPPAAGR